MTNKEYYQDLLNSREWRKYREDVLIENGFKCNHCLNKIAVAGDGVSFHRLTLFYEPGKENISLRTLSIWEHPDVHPSFLYNGISLSDYSRLTSIEKKSIYVARRKTSNEKCQDFGIVSVPSYVSLSKLELNAFDNKLLELLNWHFIYGLNVHHKYYQDGLLPWEYQRESIEVLCSTCHTNIHSEKVKYYDKGGKEKSSLTPCFRCNGLGTFPEYGHIDYGICFRCGGAKYEELIDAAVGFGVETHISLPSVNTFRLQNVRAKATKMGVVIFEILTDQGIEFKCLSSDAEKYITEIDENNYMLKDGLCITFDNFLASVD